MIWVSDANCDALYLCREWQDVTGQSPAAGLGAGWLEVIHPDDRALLLTYFQRACEQRQDFWVVHRLLRPQRSPLWVLAGAAPSFSTGDHGFLGFLGTIAEVAPPTPPEAVGSLGPFRPPVPTEETTPADVLDMIADHILTAHAFAAAEQEEALVSSLLPALYQVALLLARRGQQGTPTAH